MVQPVHSPSPVSPQARQLAEAMRAAALGCYDAPLPEEASGDTAFLTKAFASLRERLRTDAELREAAETERRTAVSGITHDLRTPLTTILGYTEALQKHLDHTPEKRDAYLAAIALRARDLSRLIDALSAANRSGGLPPVQLTPQPPAPLLRAFQEEQSGWLQEKQVTLHLELDDALVLLLDWQAFRRILMNLLTNTIKYREAPASAVSIRFRTENGRPVFTYHDDGPGVQPEEALSHLFEPGFRGPGSARRPGSGLGLHIAAQIAAAHGGRISARNENGLTISIAFPTTGGLPC